MRRWLLLLGWMACTEYSLTAKPVDDVEVVDSDPAIPLDKPVVPDRKPPVEDDEPQETAVPIDEDPPQGPVDPPVADAGVDRTVAPLVWITMNGLASFDPGGRVPLTYRWKIIRRPPGSTAVMLNTKIAKPKWFVDIAGVYELRLEVRNKAGVWDPTPDTVVVEAIPDKEFYVQLTWDQSSDLDLHLIKPGFTVFDSPEDACFCNKNPRWYGQTAQNPSLDWDVISGYGPETTTIKSPAASTWRVQVHYYGVGGAASCGGPCPNSEATLRYYVLGVEVFSQTRMLTEQGDVWEASSVEWPSQTITPVDLMKTTNRTQCQ